MKTDYIEFKQQKNEKDFVFSFSVGCNGSRIL